MARLIAERRPRFALLAARGSSDHAALYAKYLIEVLLELPAGLVSPSTTTLYGARPDFTDVLYLSVSQSGGSPDLVAATEAARGTGRADGRGHQHPSSPLSDAAELSVDIKRGRGARGRRHEDVHGDPAVAVPAGRRGPRGSGEAVAGIGELAATALAGRRSRTRWPGTATSNGW